MLAALHGAPDAARPLRVVCLSSIGAQACQPNLLNQLGLTETVLGELPLPLAFMRPAWFMENAQWDMPAARDEGVPRSFPQPLHEVFPMVATQDVCALAAALLQGARTGRRVAALEGPARASPYAVAFFSSARYASSLPGLLTNP